MTLTDNDLEQIDNYFNQTLSEKEHQAFEQRLQDLPFRRAVYEYQATTAVLNTVREQERKAFLKDINATMPPFEAPVRRLNTNWWAMAATGLVLVSIGICLFRNTEKSGVKLKSLIANDFDAYPTLYTKKGGGKEKDTKITAFEAYDAQKYSLAARLFDKAFAEKNDTILLFYKGIAELASGEVTKAETQLASLQNSNIVPQQALFFYLGLAAAENKQNEKAIELLKKAAAIKGDYQIMATHALSVLEAKK